MKEQKQKKIATGKKKIATSLFFAEETFKIDFSVPKPQFFQGSVVFPG